jgi:hypothetical protein
VAVLARQSDERWQQSRDCLFAARLLHAAALCKEAEAARLELEASAVEDAAAETYEAQVLTAGRGLLTKQRAALAASEPVRELLRSMAAEWARQSELAVRAGRPKDAKRCRVQQRKALALEADLSALCGVVPLLPGERLPEGRPV